MTWLGMVLLEAAFTPAHQSAMTGAMLLAALALALYGAWCRDRASLRANAAVWALAASIGIKSALHLIGVPFDFDLWVAIDIAAIVAIQFGCWTSRGQAIGLLIAACWPLYHLYESGRPIAAPAIELIVTAQFLLTVPWDRLAWTTRTGKSA